jgi:hypothetical protein
MDDPVNQIHKVILDLTTASPILQKATINKYFARDAAFVHPFVKTGASRWEVIQLYRWYKVLSPEIHVKIHSVGEF